MPAVALTADRDSSMPRFCRNTKGPTGRRRGGHCVVPPPVALRHRACPPATRGRHGAEDDTQAHTDADRFVAEWSAVALCETRGDADTPGWDRADAGRTEAVTGYAVACAEPALVIFRRARPDDPRPAAALQAARVSADAPRSRLQRTAAADAHRAARRPDRGGGHAADAAGDAAASAYLHPLAKATQVRHILGPAAHAARAADFPRGG